jgi:hypothetical protein
MDKMDKLNGKIEEHKANELIISPIIVITESEERIEAAGSSLDGLSWWGALLGRRTEAGIEIYEGLPYLIAAQRSGWPGLFEVVLNDLTDEQLLLRFRYTEIPMSPDRLVWLRRQEWERGVDLHLKDEDRDKADKLQYHIDLGLLPAGRLNSLESQEEYTKKGTAIYISDERADQHCQQLIQHGTPEQQKQAATAFEVYTQKTTAMISARTAVIKAENQKLQQQLDEINKRTNE